jgi:ABC-type transport system involved in multi-copper enzyme maturation permease subunit
MSITHGEPATVGIDHSGGYLRGIGDVVGLELRQRLRSRGWFILLGIWFVLIGFVTLLSWSGANASREASNVVMGSEPSGAGPMIFEIVVSFVLMFGLLVAPALSANAVNGDRSGGTLAILQVTLLTPGQILWGKFAASWIAALAFLVTSAPFLVIAVVLGGMTPGHILVSLGMLAVELAVVCAIGVGISGLANRPLFSIVVSYLTIAALVVGTAIAFALGVSLTRGTVLANEANYQSSQVYLPDAGQVPVGPGYVCEGPLLEHDTVHTERVAWLLSLNPYVVVADAIPYPPRTGGAFGMVGMFGSNGMLEGISQGARAALAGPEGTYPCAGGTVQASYLEQTTPMWPLGLALQFLLAGGLMWLGWRALRTPSRKLARGTRIA